MSSQFSYQNSPQQERPPLLRATAHSAQMPTPWLAGVASGLSVHLGMDVSVIRIVFVVTAFFGGSSILVYLLLAVFIPRDGSQPTDTSQRGATPLAKVGTDRHTLAGRRQILLVGIAFVGVASMFALANSDLDISPYSILSAVITLAGLGFTWTLTSKVTQWKTFTFWAQLLGGVLLVLMGAFIYLSQSLATLHVVRGVLLGFGIITLLVITIVPLGIGIFKQVAQSQEREIREAERATIAAHLHDSVLQTLTLIRGAADNPAQVRALALGQERELRAWLYTGQEHAASSTAEALRDTISTIESTYGIAVEVVTVGDAEPDVNEMAAVAAAGEAVTNAVRHGAPPVTVYMEVTPTQLEIFIKDKGAGFALETIPADRHGVKGSIIGRIERVGGKAAIRRLTLGTEVYLTAPRTASSS